MKRELKLEHIIERCILCLSYTPVPDEEGIETSDRFADKTINLDVTHRFPMKRELKLNSGGSVDHGEPRLHTGSR